MDSLKRCRRELVDSLQGCSLSELAEKLLHHQILDEETKNIFFSLDYDHLDSSLCARYLIQEVIRYLKDHSEDEAKSGWVRFLDVLLGLGEKPRAMSRKLKGVESMPPNSYKEDKYGEQYDTTESLLKESDILKLMKVMSKYAYKWEELSVALNLPQNVIEECRCGSSVIIKMSSVLCRWIVGGIPQAEPATLHNLKLILSGPLLNCNNAIEPLVKEFYNKETEAESCISSSSFIDFEYLPVDTDVIFGSSALLEVKVNTSKPVSYKWQRNNVQWNCFKHHIEDSILCIDEVTDSGKYSCAISAEGETVTTKEVVVNIILPPKDPYLVDKYSIFDEVPKDSWPPVSTGAFIKLALIVGQEKIPMHTIEHNIDDILESKELIEYSKVFGTFKSGLVLVEGRPGSGKTTLVCKVARDWAKSLGTLRGASMVYLISLRMLNMAQHNTLFDILRPFYIDDEDTRAALNKIKQCNGKGVCFILDGLDEYRGNNEINIIHHLIHQKIIPRAMIIVASRPIGTTRIRQQTKEAKRIEVLGFTKDNIYKYVNNYPFTTSETSSNLIRYLNIHTNVLHMCYLPVHTSMVCYMYMKMGDDIPDSETKLYEYFTSLTIVRKIKKDGDDNYEIMSLNSLPSNIEDHFIEICKKAFEMIKHSEQVISKNDFNQQLSHKPGSDDSFLGLVVVDAIAEVLGYKEMYAFLHLTSQEFLAAWHVSKIDGWSEQCQEIELLCRQEQHQVLKFYFGLVDINKCTYHFMKVINSRARIVHCLQCAFESQSKLACDKINEHIFSDYEGGKKLSLYNCSIMPLDFTAMGYVISNCSCHLSGMDIKQCFFSVEGVEAFLSALDSYELCFIKYLKMSFMNSFPAQAVNMLLHKLEYLERIDLGNTVLDDDNIMVLTKNVTLKKLKYLHIHHVCISQNEVAQLLKFGSENFCVLYAGSNPHISYDDFANNEITDFTWSDLCHVFNKQVTMHENSISSNRLFPYHGIPSESFVLCCLDFHQIQFINFLYCVNYTFIDCDIDDRAIAIIVTALTKLKANKLRSLTFDLNNITTMGALLLAYLLKSNLDIENFSVFGNNIDCTGAEAIAHSLKSCKYLKRLDLQFNNMGDFGAIAIAKATTQMDHLKMSLWNPNITEYGITEILKYKTEDCIKTVYLSHLTQFLQKYPQILSKILKHCYSLREFKVTDSLKPINSYSRIRSSEDFILEVCKKLKNFKNMVHLNMEECHIGSSQAEHLVEAFQSLHHLKILNLRLNNLCSSGTTTVACGLKHCSQLKVLNMSGNAFSSQASISALAEGLKHVPCLTELDLSTNRLFSMAGEILTAKLPKLCKLDLACCDIDSFGATALAINMKNCPSLQCLDLSGNNLCSGLVDVANALKYCDLRNLKLNCMKIGLNSARALSGTFEQCGNLRELYLNENEMDGATTEQLAVGLTYCKQLQVLYFGCNKLPPRAAARLSKCLQHGNIQKLFLLDCNINNNICTSLAIGLRYCKKLKQLDLSGNQIGPHGAKVLANEIESLHPYLVSVVDNPINDASGVYLMEQLKHIENVFLSEDNFEEETKLKLSEIIQEKYRSKKYCPI